MGQKQQAGRWDRVLWYALWGAMLVIAAANVLAVHPVVSGNGGLLLSFALAFVSGVQALLGANFLNRKERRLSGVVVLLFLLAQTGQRVRYAQPPSSLAGFDFSAYYVGAKALPAVGREVYQLPLYADGRVRLNAQAPAGSLIAEVAARSGLPWSTPLLYPPFVAVALRPLAWLSFAHALMLWKVLSVGCLLAGAWFSLDAGGVRVGRRRGVLVATGLFCFAPFSDGLFVGQVGGILFCLMAASVWLLGRQRASSSAALLALATLIKLTPVMALPVLIFHRQWRWLGYWAGWMTAFVVGSMALNGAGWGAGWRLYLAFWHRVVPAIALGAPVSANASLVAWVQELFLGGVAHWPYAPEALPAYAGLVSRVVALAAFCMATSWFFRGRRQGELVRDVSLTVLVGLAVSPISWWHHYTVALLPVLLLWAREREYGTARESALLLWTLGVGTSLLNLATTLTTIPALGLALAGVAPLLTLMLVRYGCGEAALEADEPASRLLAGATFVR